jgi:hypothetical protein
VSFSQTTVNNNNNNNKVRNRKADLSAMLVLYCTEELHLRSAKIGPALGAVEHSAPIGHPTFEDIGDEGETISIDSLALKLINVFSPILLFFCFFYSN